MPLSRRRFLTGIAAAATGAAPQPSAFGQAAAQKLTATTRSLDVNGKAGIEFELVLLGPPMVSNKVRGDAEQPRPQAPFLGVEGMTTSVRGSERLSSQIVGQGSPHPTGDEPVDSREIVLEAPSKRLATSD